MALAAQAQVQWLSKDGTSYLLARSYASVGMDVKDTCTAAIVNARTPCAWCEQFKRCTPQTPGISAPFIGNHENVLELNKPPQYIGTSRSAANQNVYFEPMSLRVANRVVTTFENRGTSVLSNRGVVDANGEVYFRVPQGPALDYELSGSLQWSGGRGHLQLIGVPNSGASSDGFSFNSNRLPQNEPTDLSSKGTLTPGVYRLFWFATADNNSPGVTVGASVDMQLKFTAACDAVAGPALPEPADAREVTGLFGPFASPDLAAAAAEPALWRATSRQTREFGLVIVKDLRDGKMYLTPPVMDSSSLLVRTLEGGISADDYNHSRDLAFQRCARYIKSYSYVASVHSHPVQLGNSLPASVFSPTDFNGAIADAKAKSRLFDRIYLLPPDRCIRSFKAQRGDVECSGLCKELYPRVQPVLNCPRGGNPPDPK